MITDPLTGARKPEQIDGPLGGLQIGNAVDDLAPFTVPRFGTTGERDTAYADFVAAGGVLEDGMMCTVAGVLYRRESGAWALHGSRQAVCQFTAAQPGGTIPANTLWGMGNPTIAAQSGGTFTKALDKITPPLTGLWSVTWMLDMDTTYSSRSYMQVVVGGVTYRQPMGGPGEDKATLSLDVPVAAGQDLTFQFSSNHSTGPAGSSSRGTLVRIGDLP